MMKKNIILNIVQNSLESEALAPKIARLKPSVPSFRRGIAMVELIFSIVIIGIVLMSTPMLVQQSTQSSNVALQQESISALATHMGIVMSKHWDEENTADTNNTESPILAIAGNSGELNISSYGTGATSRNIRAGMQNMIARDSAISPDIILFASTGAFGEITDGDIGVNRFDDIDDYHNHTTTLTTGATSITGDYIDKNLTISTNVTYAEDIPIGGLSSTMTLDNFFNNKTGIQQHIKFVSVRLTTNSDVTELDKNISMSAFSCNIGTYQPRGAFK